MKRERELKFRVPAEFEWPELPGIPAVAAALSAPRPVTSRYYDTAERHLAAASASLRHRSSDGWTVKLPQGRKGARLDRLEFQFAAAPEKPPREALSLLRGILRGHPVEPAADVRVLRSDARFRPPGSDYALLFVDDRVEITRVGGSSESYRELEIELEGEVPAAELKAIERALRKAGADAKSAKSKYEAALGGRLEPELPARELSKDSSIAELIGEAIAASVRQILERDPFLRLNADAVSIHKTRVAVRRLRSHLRTFQTLLDPNWVSEVAPDLRNFARRLGRVRDLDVLFEGLLERGARLNSEELGVAERLLENLPMRREEEMAPLEFFLASDTYVALLERLLQAAKKPPVQSNTLVRDHVSALVGGPWKRARRAAKKLGPDSADTELHRFRILIKRCRYAVDTVVPVAGKAALRWAEDLTSLQDVLGEHQDACHAQAWLRDQAKQRPAEEAFLAGQLYATEVRRAEALRARWPETWNRVKRHQDWWR